jgi:hypothetical protein
MTEPARLLGVFYEPGKVFADVAERPRWLVPVIVSILLAVSLTYAISTHVGWDQTIRQAFANNSRVADLPADQREQLVARSTKFASIIGWVGAIIFPPLFVLIVAGVLTGIFNGLLGTELKFTQMFGITAYAFLVRGLYNLLLILLLYLKPPEDFNIQVSPFSPAAYMNRQENPKWLMSLAGSLDLFTIWTIVLLAIGFSVAAKKLSFSKALISIAIPWLILVAAQMVLQSSQ